MHENEILKGVDKMWQKKTHFIMCAFPRVTETDEICNIRLQNYKFYLKTDY